MNSLHNHNLQILNALNKEREKTREEKEIVMSLCKCNSCASLFDTDMEPDCWSEDNEAFCEHCRTELQAADFQFCLMLMNHKPQDTSVEVI
jgi:hypothetical protein